MSESENQKTETAKAQAVDTGRRIDPALLKKTPTTIRRSSENASEKESSPSQNRFKQKTFSNSKPQEASLERVASSAPEKRKEKTNRVALPDFPALPPREPVSDEEIGNFAEMLAAEGDFKRVRVRVGQKIRATCVHITQDHVFFSLSTTQEASASIAEFLDPEGLLTISPQETVEVFVISAGAEIEVSRKVSKDQLDMGMLENAQKTALPIEGTVASVNKGGYEISLNGKARGFCPLGQMDIHYVDDPNIWVGKTATFIVKDIKEGGKNILLSRRQWQENERSQQAQKTLANLEVGQHVQATVVRTQPFGVFVEFGGLDGLIPAGELSFSRNIDPSTVVKMGDKLTVEIRRIEIQEQQPMKPKISLSLKSLQQNPYDARSEELVEHNVLSGTVTKVEAFGAFIELFPGIQGLAHVSELADRRIAHPKEVVKVGDTVNARILSFDRATEKLSLSLKDAALEAARTEARAAKQNALSKMDRGQRVTGVVEKIEKFGVFVKLSDGVNALLPASESGVPRQGDLTKSFAVGDEVQALIIDKDERGRVRISKVALEQADEREEMQKYQNAQGSGKSLGSMSAMFGNIKL